MTGRETASGAPTTSTPSLHVNISIMFRELEPLRRPAAAAAAGFDAVECWWPFPGAEPTDAERERFVRSFREAGVRLAALNLDGGELAKGERGLLSHPGREAHVERNLAAAVDLAGELGCGIINALYGNRVLGLDPRDQDELAVTHLGMAAAAARSIGATVVVEALNPWENPQYPLNRTAQVIELMGRVERDSGERIRCLYDIYHAQRTEGELIETIRRHGASFGHVQLADAPGRGEPGSGEIAFPRVLEALRTSGYRGAVGLEYLPTTTTTASLAVVDAVRDALGEPSRVIP